MSLLGEGFRILADVGRARRRGTSADDPDAAARGGIEPNSGGRSNTGCNGARAGRRRPARMPRVASRRFAVRQRLIRRLGHATSLVIAVVLLVGCGPNIPASLRTPSVAGVVEESTRLPNGHWEYRLKGDQTLEVDYDRTTSLLAGPDVGRLLLAGADPEGRQWVAGISGDWPGRPEGCYLFPAQGRSVGDWIETTTGFRLPKSSAFVDARSRRSAEFTSDQGVFCLDQRGEVTSYDVR